jgi:inosose dehydratase
MTHPRIRYACQTYSWQMSINTYRGRLTDMLAVTAQAGFAGFEPELIMLGEDWSRDKLHAALDEHRVSLAALCLVQPWRGPVETAAERADADRVIDAVAGIPGAIINLCQYPGSDRLDLRERQVNALRCLDAVSRRAEDAGVHCTFHPNSPSGSVFRTREDYDRLLELLPEPIGFTPDLGHIAQGDMDPLTVVSTYRERVDHLHVKDMYADGRWAPTGKGIIDIRGVVGYLAQTGYRGWITMEDESAEAEHDPDNAVLRNGRFVDEMLGTISR